MNNINFIPYKDALIKGYNSARYYIDGFVDILSGEWPRKAYELSVDNMMIDEKMYMLAHLKSSFPDAKKPDDIMSKLHISMASFGDRLRIIDTASDKLDYTFDNDGKAGLLSLVSKSLGENRHTVTVFINNETAKLNKSDIAYLLKSIAEEFLSYEVNDYITDISPNYCYTLLKYWLNAYVETNYKMKITELVYLIYYKIYSYAAIPISDFKYFENQNTTATILTKDDKIINDTLKECHRIAMNIRDGEDIENYQNDIENIIFNLI
jgi:hypothetical protein